MMRGKAIIGLFVVGAAIAALLSYMLQAPAYSRLTQQGDSNLEAGHYQAALENYRAALLVNPEYLAAQMGQAITLIHLEQTQRAEQYLSALIDHLLTRHPATEPEQKALAIAFANRGSLRDRRGDYGPALADYHTALAIDPKLANAPNVVERIVLRTDHTDLAERAAYLQSMLLANPNNH